MSLYISRIAVIMVTNNTGRILHILCLESATQVQIMDKIDIIIMIMSYSSVGPKDTMYRNFIISIIIVMKAINLVMHKFSSIADLE